MELTYTVTVRVLGADGESELPTEAQQDFANQFLADRLMIGDERPVAENAYSGFKLWGVSADRVDRPPAVPVD